VKTAEQRIQEYEAKTLKWSKKDSDPDKHKRPHVVNAEIDRRHRAGWKRSTLRTLENKRSSPKILVSAVYGLVDPIVKELFYVGVTNNLRDRVRGHHSSNNLPDVHDRVEHIAREGRKVQVVKLQLDPPKENRLCVEAEWISFFKEAGLPLLNKDAALSKPKRPRKAYKRRKSFYKF